MATWLTPLVLYQSAYTCFGQGTIYFDRSDFELAIAGSSGIRADVDFQPPLPPGGIDDGVGVRYFLPLTMSGITFHSGGALYIRSISAGGNRVLNGYDSLSPLMVDMNGPAVAFGADFASLLSPVYTSFLATVTLNDGRVFTFTARGPELKVLWICNHAAFFQPDVQ
jgi:hypothetical protein